MPKRKVTADSEWPFQRAAIEIHVESLASALVARFEVCEAFSEKFPEGQQKRTELLSVVLDNLTQNAIAKIRGSTNPTGLARSLLAMRNGAPEDLLDIWQLFVDKACYIISIYAS